jgi:hypothetical protein
VSSQDGICIVTDLRNLVAVRNTEDGVSTQRKRRGECGYAMMLCNFVCCPAAESESHPCWWLAYLPSYISRWASTTVHAHPTACSAMQALQLAGRTSRIYITVLPSAVLQHAGRAKKHQERCHLRPLRRFLSLPVNDVKTWVKDPANIYLGVCETLPSFLVIPLRI